MAINVRPKTETAISELLSSGHYVDASDVVEKAVDLLIQYDHQVEHMRQLIGVAEAQVERGDVIKMTDTFWDDLDRDVDDALARGVVPNPDVRP